MPNTNTLARVRRQIDSYLDSATRALSPTASLVPDGPSYLRQDEVDCQHVDTGQPLGTRFAQRVYPVAGLDAADPGAVYAAFRGWLTGNGFTITVDNEHAAGHQSVIGTNEAGYSLTLDSIGDRYHLAGSTPCTHPDEPPEPTA